MKYVNILFLFLFIFYKGNLIMSNENDLPVQKEPEIFYPNQNILDNANIKEYDNLYKYSIENPEAFWAEQAESLDWYQKWEKVLDSSNAPFYKWFTGGKINIVHNAIDRHLKTWRKNKLAIIWEGETGDVRTFSYHALNREVCKFANILKSMGVKRIRHRPNGKISD